MEILYCNKCQREMCMTDEPSTIIYCEDCSNVYTTLIRNEIKNFAEEMELKMRINDDEKGDSWKSMSQEQLHRLLCGEIDEYHSAMTKTQARGELVDTSVLCMMVHNILGRSENEMAKTTERIPAHYRGKLVACGEFEIISGRYIQESQRLCKECNEKCKFTDEVSK